MTIFFSFSDENGNYKKIREKNFLKSHPYYVRSSFMIYASEWKKISNAFMDLKSKYSFPQDKEIKWSYIWSLYKYQKNKESIPPEKPFFFLKDFDLELLIEYIAKALSLFKDLRFIKIIITATYNKKCKNINELSFYKMHIQEHMQRIEMEVQDNENNLCVFFIDPLSEDKNKYLRNSYNQLFRDGDFINSYKHIKDSLNLEYSHHSVGVQLADYISGCFAGNLRGFEKSRQLFQKYVYPYLRRNNDEKIMGYGIREVPKNETIRDLINNCI